MNFYNHYLELKKQNAGAMVLYRVGDFYEMYGQDAIAASKALDLVLTSRDVGQAERVPMTGVPKHCVDNYVKMLIENGCKVAICEPPKAQPQPQKTEPAQPCGRVNLDAASAEEVILKEYLEANASDTLVKKINNGVKIEKDGKTLVSKKTLQSFLVYACNEAQKLADKGARCKAVEHTTVFGWMIHYFEEDGIEGTLYNEDGSAYKPTKAAKPSSKNPAQKAAKPTAQATTARRPISFFDMMESSPISEELALEDAQKGSKDEYECDDATPLDECDEYNEESEAAIPSSIPHQNLVADTPKPPVATHASAPLENTMPLAIPRLIAEIFGNLLVVR